MHAIAIYHSMNTSTDLHPKNQCALRLRASLIATSIPDLGGAPPLRGSTIWIAPWVGDDEEHVCHLIGSCQVNPVSFCVYQRGQLP